MHTLNLHICSSMLSVLCIIFMLFISNIFTYNHIIHILCHWYVCVMWIIFTCLDNYYRVTTLYVKTSDPDESRFSCTVENCVILICILPSNWLSIFTKYCKNVYSVKNKIKTIWEVMKIQVLSFFNKRSVYSGQLIYLERLH